MPLLTRRSSASILTLLFLAGCRVSGRADSARRGSKSWRRSRVAERWRGQGQHALLAAPPDRLHQRRTAADCVAQSGVADELRDEIPGGEVRHQPIPDAVVDQRCALRAERGGTGRGVDPATGKTIWVQEPPDGQPIGRTRLAPSPTGAGAPRSGSSRFADSSCGRSTSRWASRVLPRYERTHRPQAGARRARQGDGVLELRALCLQ